MLYIVNVIMSAKKWLLAILVFVFLARIVGVSYGLPLWLVDDEPPFTLAALKMLQLKTLIPASQLADFKTVLYYPPYLSYLYLPFFAALVAIKFLFYGGPSALFASFLLTDLSWFYVIARTINVVLATLSVFLIYKITETVLQDRRPALLAAFFVSTSLIHIALSIVSRHWLSVFFFTALVLYWLSRPNLSEKQRYFGAIFSAGIGVGFAIINLLLAPLIAFWYLIYEKKPVLAAFKEKFFYKLYAMFAALAALPYILYPASLGFSADTTAGATKTIFGAITSPIFFAKTIAISEFVLIAFAILGLVFTFKNNRRIFWTFAAFIYSYSIIFYLVFRFEPRFFMGLLPFYAILAGYGFYEIQKMLPSPVPQKIFLLVLLIPLAFVLRLDWLAIQNDSRTLAREWAEENLPSGTKIMVLARLTRFSTNKDAVSEQEKISASSLRKVDRADAELGNLNFHTLNLFDASNQSFYENVESYIKQNHYEYLVIQPDYKNSQYFKGVMAHSELLKTFGSGEAAMSIAESQFLKSPAALFQIKELGPEIKVYKLK
ncbi:MAG: hypothetical protein UX43_C0001G0091 [Candidatus Giovannonibacteria bacterium GW2011_GWB1_46_20]|uniref:Glycosyltransferase RgtA/B/C/D-like domain-containing protein n=2 Tax=Candidatus Giovannoniibacteriota TaxID=1752738 RepID=A0A0G1IM12_9BACT|nr:MAG: hypothetical protein UW53_C0001G0111 [Candidatus Giovannonibacteria bacterium GW2011_GWA1_44_25]KKU30319.1 MAG: hypothetical protein UX43_C0001G0091 [Candidatus Giovannonibacteria bacterium GW2011_GWB1_46_20]